MNFYSIIHLYFICLLEAEKSVSLWTPPVYCSEDTFKCDDFKCIPKTWLCNGSFDCQDHTDELDGNCPENVTIQTKNIVGCSESYFRCSVGPCIPRTWLCDNTKDCVDGSDEKNCEKMCSDSEFQCDNGLCVDKRWKCDGHFDCDDWSDEKHCDRRGTEGSSVSVSPQIKDNSTFSCSDGFSIPRFWRCDGDDDCLDGSDEVNCSSSEVSLTRISPFCNVYEFVCDNSDCILESWVCDGASDCLHGEDERNCTDIQHKNLKNGEIDSHQVIQSDSEVSTSHIFSVESQSRTSLVEVICNSTTHFTCSDGKCITNLSVCDGKSDCSDGKDESREVCGINECLRNNGGCSQKCENTRDGHSCSCFDGYKLLDDYNCEDVNECVEVPGACSQLCTNTRGGFRCSCSPGYLTDPLDRTRCKTEIGDTFLLFSHSFDIRKLRLKDGHIKRVVRDTRSATGLDFVYEDNLIIWSDRKDKKVYRANMDNGESREEISSGLEISADGLAVDWIHRNLYLTDVVNASVILMSWDGRRVKTVASGGVTHPRAVIVSPLTGYLYWTDWGVNPKIERSGLDGSGRETVVSKPHVSWPNGITLDGASERLFWCDGRLRTISSSNPDGSDIKVVLYSAEFLGHSYSLSVFGDNLYWTDWSQLALFSANKFTGKQIRNISAGHLIESPRVVHVLHPYRQPHGENVCSNHSCLHFCSRDFTGEPKCSCADGFVLSQDNFSCYRLDDLDPFLGPFSHGFAPAVSDLTTNLPLAGLISAVSVTLLFVAIGIAVYITWYRLRVRPIKRIKFENEVYQKTTSETNENEDLSVPEKRQKRSPALKFSCSKVNNNDSDTTPLTIEMC